MSKGKINKANFCYDLSQERLKNQSTQTTFFTQLEITNL